jgi:hypothetical protein
MAAWKQDRRRNTKKTRQTKDLHYTGLYILEKYRLKCKTLLEQRLHVKGKIRKQQCTVVWKCKSPRGSQQNILGY